jgi:uncharacterized protein
VIGSGSARRRGPAWRAPAVAALALAAASLAAAWLGTARPAAARVVLPPHSDRSVHDLAGVLPAQTIDILERRHKALFDATGVAIVMITVPRLEGEPIDDFAVRVGSEWGAGRKGEDRGIVVALSIEERRVFIATGYGVEGFLPDGRVGAILDRLVIPRLKANDYPEAMLQASAALVSAAAQEYGVTVDGIGPDGRGVPGAGPEVRFGPGAFLLVILVLAVSLYLFIRHPILFWMFFSGPRRGGGGISYGGFRGGFGGNSGFGGFGGGGFGGGGVGRGF